MSQNFNKLPNFITCVVTHTIKAVEATNAATIKMQQSQQQQKQRPQNGSSPSNNKSSDHKMAAVPAATKAATTKWQ